MMARKLRWSWSRKLGREAGQKLGIGKPVACDSLQEVLREKSMTPLQKACISSYVTQSIWTKVKLREAGYQLEETECICGHHSDDLLHRFLDCPAASEVRERVVTQEEMQKIKDYVREPGSPFFAGLQEAFRGRVRFIEGTGAEEGRFWCRDPDKTPWEALQGQLYTDGSCFKTGCRQYNVAGWAVVKLDEQGEVYAALWGPVGRNLPQT